MYTNSEVKKEKYINLVNKSIVDIFLYDTSNKLNNIQEKIEINNELLEELELIRNFYKQLSNDFTSINVPKQFEKDNKLLISYLEKCIECLNLIVDNKELNIIKNSSINFIENNYEIIRVLENIRISYERNNY